MTESQLLVAVEQSLKTDLGTNCQPMNWLLTGEHSFCRIFCRFLEGRGTFGRILARNQLGKTLRQF